MKKVYALIVMFGFCALFAEKAIAKPGYEGFIPTTGLGIGKSYGGIGVRMQWRFGGIVGGGFHFGGGYFPGAPLGVSIGAKVYAYKGLYINMQYGTMGFEQSYTLRSSQVTLVYGPSLLIGEDFMFGKKKRLGCNVAIGIMSPFNSNHQALVLDLGFLVRI